LFDAEDEVHSFQISSVEVPDTVDAVNGADKSLLFVVTNG